MYKPYAQMVLWDIEGDKIDTLSREFVIRRVLSYGTIGLVILAIKEYGLSFVKDVFYKMKPTAITEKKYNYFKNYLLI